MDKQKSEEIIGYRIGQGLFCVECYEKDAKRLKEVQNPEDLEVKFPSRPITVEDVGIFICEECETIKGKPRILSSDRLTKMQRVRDLDGLQITIEDCAKKVAFLDDFFSQPLGINDSPEFSDNGLMGLCQIIRNLQDELESVATEISEARQQGRIIEKKVS